MNQYYVNKKNFKNVVDLVNFILITCFYNGLYFCSIVYFFVCVFLMSLLNLLGFPDGSDGKESACSVGDLGLIPELGRSPGGGHGNSLQ